MLCKVSCNERVKMLWFPQQQLFLNIVSIGSLDNMRGSCPGRLFTNYVLQTSPTTDPAMTRSVSDTESIVCVSSSPLHTHSFDPLLFSAAMLKIRRWSRRSPVDTLYNWTPSTKYGFFDFDPDFCFCLVV